MKTALFKKNSGFTLIELLVVIGILAILLSIVLIAINPARQFGQANDTKRRSAVTQILNAVGAYTADNGGQLPASITTVETEIADTGIDLCDDLVPNYIPALPQDPEVDPQVIIDSSVCGGAYETGYTIVRNATTSAITVRAPNADITLPIEITR